jgi:hypothetical protein
MTLKDGSQMIVEGPRVIEDTVFGWSEGGTEDVMIAVKDIRQVRARKMSTVRTALIPITALTAAIAVYSLVETNGTTSTLQQNECDDMEIDC